MSAAGLAGRVLDRRYQLEARIGGGGMGEVYRGRHLMMNQRVAVKILRPDVAQDASAVQRFVREARSTFRLDHPNCVRVTDFGATDDGLMYLVMEYLDGRSVAQEIDCDGPLHARRVVHIGTQVCAALACAHELGLIHRDLKPDNLMLVHKRGDPDTVKVLDFGLAKIITDPRGGFTTALPVASLTREGMIFGTPAYMSPEQAVDDPLTPRSDLYALGVVLYEMLTGVLPFDNPNHMEILAAHVSRDAVPPAERRPDLAIPPALSALVMWLMAKQPGARPESARALATELERLGASGISSGRPAVPADVAASSTVDLASDEVARMAGPEPEQPSAGRSRRRALVATLSLVAGIAVVAGLLLVTGGESGDARRVAGEAESRAIGRVGELDAHVAGARRTSLRDAARVIDAKPADANPVDVADASVSDGQGHARRPDKSGRDRHSSLERLSEARARELETHLERAERARSAGNILEQMAHADSALKIAPDHARAAYLLGDALLGSDRERACRYLRKARLEIAQARESYRRAGCGRAD